ncbi:tRNA-dihydrouridine synthase 3 [Friedmanniomyces endolithicus]|uniref:tRNA-dihydrouridine(47) synthase [NAD(P)(+)] n=1 Tax=Friedmanniomyces endolithicus TaxID=329885 RepID=A0AAN6KFP4_9PEZI|nr:tRNA-dihydrouridine synthase 3 [Friedmanniomyces endolithicus]KAK0789505.1 tRNA-dihydrouridine synthase 3 [Friedmanniomyces endolithicus]KAK0803668.1 tRNA-dihydrouridine synthase 3 [Friedmanniomyces endolithicus]KAK0857281.1 tRNA-dihydrouridine synthase 3 [Friedmanniomyces endolithicus]KAK0865516.1 tRNA-dihydrouridine synthase 3 [Friedmanniomyces endolithicus]
MAEHGMADDVEGPISNPLDQSEPLEAGSADNTTKTANPQAEILPGDSAITKAEKVERHGDTSTGDVSADFEHPAPKRRRLEQEPGSTAAGETEERPTRQKGVTPIRKEFLVSISRAAEHDHDEDAAEASGKTAQPHTVGGRGGKKKTPGGQNHNRQFGRSRDEIQLCMSRAKVDEFATSSCQFGEKCKYEHNIRKYLKDGKRADLDTFGSICPVWEVKGKCSAGWRCRFAGSHSKEVEREDGRKELVLVEKEKSDEQTNREDELEEEGVGVVNVISNAVKISLRKKHIETGRSDQYLKWMNEHNQDPTNGRVRPEPKAVPGLVDDEGIPINVNKSKGDPSGVHDNRAGYVEPPFRASEKRRIYYGPETPVLAPLTTQGNLPFRRLCVSLGAQVTWSEMAMGLPLLGGEKGEWALIKAHESETAPPAYSPKTPVLDYNRSRDSKFGVQIAANKPWLALKTTEILTTLCPQIRAIDLNCGCPIDLVCRQGAGSALLDSNAKLEKTLRGMNAVSGETPITVKIRMGTKDKHPTSEKLVQRLVIGGPEAQEHGEDPCGVAAITLHGRSKQQRYSRSADWQYIADCASLVKKLKSERSNITDTAREPDARDLPASSFSGTGEGLPYFCGNGDILSHVDYNAHLQDTGIDACMIARGALIKPWIFEEIAQNQYLDKSASERLGYIEQFARNGLEYWGSDEIGVGTTRRFLLEWLSFSCRYVPIGILDELPPKFGDRPPAFKGRSELETLLSSGDYRDWIKISEMFLGPAHKDFQFQPKHKSNSYEIEAEG